MNEDYLWDKSGEVDPDVERLEQRLASLRFKRPAEPLPLPKVQPRWSSRFRSTSLLAAAAALALLLLAGGLWVALRRSSVGENGVASAPAQQITPAQATSKDAKPEQSEQADSGPRPPLIEPPGMKTATDKDKLTASPETAAAPRRKPQNSSGARPLVARRSAPKFSPPRQPQQQEMTREKGEQAREQLIKALHIASEKLNAVQKKIQGGEARSPIS